MVRIAVTTSLSACILVQMEVRNNLTLPKRIEWLLLGLIFLVGLGLRLHQLTVDSLWVDEFGVVEAVRRPDLAAVIEAARHHVMAMPLDYVVAWVWARFVSEDIWLRLPAVFWGAATLAAGFLLYRRLGGSQVALWAVFFLAFSPFHIQYSQELRFYASMTFFYTLASGLFLRAVTEPAARNWALATVFTLIGFFFHFYVILALVNAVFWVFISVVSAPKFRKARLYLVRSLIAGLLGGLVGILTFGNVYPYDIQLLMYESSFAGLMGTGLGWIPYYPAQTLFSYIWGALLGGLALLGIGRELVRRPRGLAASLFYSAVFQILAIIVLNELKNYFLVPRQFLIFLPVMLFFSARGLTALIESASLWMKKRAVYSDRSTVLWVNGFILVIFLLSSLPALTDFYRGNKGDVLGVSRRLVETWQPGDRILVLPNYNAAIYAYYLDQLGASPVKEALRPIDWQELAQAAAPGAEYVITEYPVASEHLALIRAFGLEPLIMPEAISRYAQVVWWKSPSALK